MCRASIISLRYKPSQLECATLLLAVGCRPIRIKRSHAHSESAALQAEPARMRCASSRCWAVAQ